MSKKILSIVLALVMVLAMSTVALVSVSADLADLPEKAEGTKRYFFYMPEQWKNDYAYTAGIYWWEGTDACSAWPGYEATPADVDGVYYYDVPADVTTIIWNNYLDGGTDMTLPIYQAAVQTKNIGSEYYEPGESDNYPDGLDDVIGFDGMIYVTDFEKTEINDYSGKMTYAGEWCYYYGNGEYGFTPVKGDGEVFTDPAFNWDPDATIPEQEATGDEPVVTPDETVPSETETVPSETETVPSESETVTDAPEVEANNSVTTSDGAKYVTTVGDVLTYTVDLTAARLFENIQAIVSYDAEKLELTRIKSDDPDVEDWEVEGPAFCPNLEGVILNAGEAGVVKFNASKVAGYNFKENKNLVTLEFTVIAEGDATIDLTVEEMTIKGGDDSYFASGEAVITDGLTLTQAIAGNTVPETQPSTVPSETESTAPSETESTAPSETESTAPSETESTAPSETESTAPSETESTAPTETKPTETKPTETEAKPTETTPAPTQGATSDKETATDKPVDAPTTGAAAYIYVVVAVLSMAALAVVVLRKKVNG